MARFIPNDTLYPDQWYLRRLAGIEKVWSDYTGAGVTVGVVDSGLDPRHPDLARYDPALNAFADGEMLDPGRFAPNTLAHGTAVAGVIAGAQDGDGIVGVAFDARFGVATNNDINFRPRTPHADEALARFADFDVTNHSWAGVEYFIDGSVNGLADAVVLGAFERAAEIGRGGLGTVHVKGAGNDQGAANSGVFNTGRHTIVVGGIDSDGIVADASRFGGPLSVVAPSQGNKGLGFVVADVLGGGGFDRSPGVEGDYQEVITGTSFATPQVSGIVGLMLEANPDLGWRDVQEILAQSAQLTGAAPGATPLPEERFGWRWNDADNSNGGGLHFSESYGFGAVDARAAVRMAEAWSHFGPSRTSANEVTVEGAALEGLDFSVDATGAFVALPVSVTAPEGFEIEFVEATLDLAHDDFYRLDIFLNSPADTSTLLHGESPDPSALFLDKTFPDGAVYTFGARAFFGETASGTWTLFFREETGGADGGMLDGLSLTFHGRVSDDDDVYHYTDEVFVALEQQPDRIDLVDPAGDDWLDFSAVTGHVDLRMQAGYAQIDGRDVMEMSEDTWIENAFGGDGDDRFVGAGDANALHGARGGDSLFGRGGDDTLAGGAGGDDLRGGPGADLLRGGTGSDAASGGVGADRLFGGRGADTLFGNAGNDALTGGSGPDSLDGGRGADTLTDGAGHDTLAGGPGADIFVLRTDGSPDTIIDYQHRIDSIRLDVPPGTEITLETQAPGSVRIGWAGETLTVSDGGAGALTATDFSVGDLVGTGGADLL